MFCDFYIFDLVKEMVERVIRMSVCIRPNPLHTAYICFTLIAIEEI